MTELVAWLVFPLILVVTSIGTGLLVERVAGIPLPAALVGPVGFCAAIALIGPSFALGGGAGPALALLVATTLAGAWSSRAGLLRRFGPGLGAGAGVAAYALYMAPVVLGGEATFLGYNFLNDTATHLVLVDYVSEFGRRDPGFLPASSFKSAVEGYVGKSYPLGSHELLAALRAAVDVEPARLYQSFLATAIGLAAAALFALVRRAGAPAVAAAGAAFVALTAHLLFSFNLQGGIKELTFVATLATAAAVGGEVLQADRPARGAAVLALPALAAYAIYGLAAVAWLVPLALALVGLALVGRRSLLRSRLLPAAATALIVFGVLGFPTILASVEYYEKGRETLTSEAALGPLLGPLDPAQAAGVWLQGDYRQRPPETRSELNRGLIAVALGLAAIGVGLALRARAGGPLLFLLPSLLAWLAVSRSGSPYVDAKLLAVLSPAVVLFACIGVGALWRGRLRPVAAAAAAVLAGAIAMSDALAYRVALPAPMDRLEELSEIGDRFEGRGPMLVNEFEEYAKHFARAALPVAPYDPWTPAAAELRQEGLPIYAHAYTLDELSFDFVRRFEFLTLRRSPAESRPPAGYERAWRGRFYEVWSREETNNASDHEPLGRPLRNPVSASSRPPCAVPRRLAARHDLIAAVRPEGIVFDVAAQTQLPPGWRRVPGYPFGLVARFGGSVAAESRTGSGPHRVWVKGRLYRESEVLVDGRPVGRAQHPNGPNQWAEVGRVELSPGLHRVELRRPTGSLAPGDAQSDEFGPIVLQPETEPRIVRVPKGEGRRLCGRALDWIERFTP